MSTIFASTLVDTADHHQMLRDSVAKLVGSFGRCYFQDVVKRNAKPVELWEALGASGFLGVHISEEYGGGGSGLADYNVIVEEAAAQGLFAGINAALQCRGHADGHGPIW